MKQKAISEVIGYEKKSLLSDKNSWRQNSCVFI